MVEDVLKYKRLDGVDAALNKIAGGLLRRRPPDPPARCRGCRRSRLPVQVIWGREDRVVPVAHSEGLPSSIKVTVLDHAGHLVHMEKAAEVNALFKVTSGSREAAWSYILDAVRLRSRPVPAGRISMIDFKSVLGTLLEFRPDAVGVAAHRPCGEPAGRGPWLDPEQPRRQSGCGWRWRRSGKSPGRSARQCQAGGKRHQGPGSGRQSDGRRRRRCARGRASGRSARLTGQGRGGRCCSRGARADRHVRPAEGHGRRRGWPAAAWPRQAPPRPAAIRTRPWRPSRMMPAPSSCCGP